MTTRCFSRLAFGISTFALITVLLFGGSKTSASKGDRSAPTTPGNLAVTAVTSTSVTLSWSPSSDNSGKFSYKVNIRNLSNSAYNSLAAVSQTQTTYTAKFLATNSSYTFSVFAVDGNGNRSADSNLASAKTFADTTPPSGPVLQATVLSPSQVQLTWTKSTDDVSNSCCTYSVIMNGAPYTQHVNWVAAPPDKLSATIRHLKPGSTNTFAIRATDSTGSNFSTSNTVSPTTLPSNDTIPPTAPTNLHFISTNGCAEVFLGWNEASDESDPQDAVEYEIFVNGVLSPLPISAGVDFDFVYGTAFGDNIFTVKAVDRSGNSSAASSPLKLFLWPC